MTPIVVRAALLAIAAAALAPSLAAQSTDSAPVSRALESPLASPPFPSSDWVNAYVVGEPDGTPDYPLQKAVFGTALAVSRVKIYGWAEVGANVSTSSNTNAPLVYGIVPNAVELDQLVLRFDRAPNTAQVAQVDWGFRFTSLFGIDYRATTAKGWFSDQLLQHNALYGYDPVELYGVLYLPRVAQGMVLKLGRYISPADIEDPFAVDNYLFSHSLPVAVDPTTFTGVQGTVRLSPQWELTIGADAGSDMAPWSNSARLNGQLLVRWVSRSGSDGLWGGLNSIGSGSFTNGHDDLQQVVAVWGHRFDSTVHIQTEAYYEWQFDAARGGSCNYGPVRSYGGGGGCGPIIPGRSEALGLVNYLEFLFSPNDYLSVRNDYLNDVQGQRTGYATPYTSLTVGWAHWISSLFLVRPEVRYERSYLVPAYDGGIAKDQATASIDLIARF